MLKKLVTLALIGLYALIFGEYFVRFMDPQPLFPRYVQGADDGIRMNVPNAVYRQKSPEVNVEVRINSQGIRADRDIPVQKPADTCRIITLGDSFMMGYEVELEDSYAYLVQEYLTDQGVKAETINLAVSGFGTAEHLVALKHRGAHFNPDLIIMEWHSTDPKDNQRSNLYKLEDNRLTEKNTSYLPAIKTRQNLMKVPGYEWLINNSHLYSAVRERASVLAKKLLLELRQKKSSNPEDVESDSTTEQDDKALADQFPDTLDEQLILEVNRYARSLGASLLLLDAPVEWHTADSLKSSMGYLDLDLLGDIPWVTPYPLFKRDSELGKSYYFKQGQGHWTVEGNQVTAKLTTDFIINNGLCGQR